MATPVEWRTFVSVAPAATESILDSFFFFKISFLCIFCPWHSKKQGKKQIKTLKKPVFFSNTWFGLSPNQVELDMCCHKSSWTRYGPISSWTRFGPKSSWTRYGPRARQDRPQMLNYQYFYRFHHVSTHQDDKNSASRRLIVITAIRNTDLCHPLADLFALLPHGMGT